MGTKEERSSCVEEDWEPLPSLTPPHTTPGDTDSNHHRMAVVHISKGKNDHDLSFYTAVATANPRTATTSVRNTNQTPLLLQSVQVSEREAILDYKTPTQSNQPIVSLSSPIQPYRTGGSRTRRGQKNTREGSIDIHQIQQKLEMKRKIQQELLHHPISQFGGKFVWNFLCCFWHSNGQQKRLGLVFLVLGCVLQILSFLYVSVQNCYLMAFASFTFIATLLLAMMILTLLSIKIDCGSTKNNILTQLDPSVILVHLGNQFSSIWKSGPWNEMSLERFFDQNSIRYLFLLAFLSPTFLEMRILTFLTYTIVQDTKHFMGIILLLLILLLQQGLLFLRYCDVDTFFLENLCTRISIKNPSPSMISTTKTRTTTNRTNKNYNDTTHHHHDSTTTMLATSTTSMATFWTFSKPKQNISFLQYKMDAWIYLYCTAIFYAFVSSQERQRKYILSGPFLIAVGSFLIFSNPYPSIWSNQQDQEDLDPWSNVLQNSLRMTLREILVTIGENVTEDEMLQIALLRWIADYWSHDTSRSRWSSVTSTGINTSTRLPPYHHHHVTQNYDHGEARPNGNVNAIPPSSDASTNTSSTVPMEQNINSHSLHDPTRTHFEWDDLFAMLQLTVNTMYNEVAAVSNNTTNTTRFHSSEKRNQSVLNLQNMLESLDIDTRAKPAVLAYKSAVENFPPHRNTSIAISCIRRCPAALSVIFLLGIGSSHLPLVILVLVPMLTMEYFRIHAWFEACWSAVNIPNEQYPQSVGNSQHQFLPEDLDPMYILLSGEDFRLNETQPLLQVWRNILASVHSLESGLVIAKCVHTAHVASKLAFNVMSLAPLALTINDKGWMYGMSTILADMVQFHSQKSPNTAKTSNSNYTQATLEMIKNSRTLSRNLTSLFGDNGEGHDTLKAAVKIFHGIGARNSTIMNQSQTEIVELVTTVDDKKTEETVETTSIMGEENNHQTHLFLENRECGQDNVGTLQSMPPSLDDLIPVSNDEVLINDTYPKIPLETLSSDIHNSDTIEFSNRSTVLDVYDGKSNEGSDVDEIGHDPSWVDVQSLLLDLSDASETECTARHSRNASVGNDETAEEENNVMVVCDPKKSNRSEELSSSRELDSKENHNVFHWIGGGLALVGAIVGGLAVAHQHSSQQGRIRRNPSNQDSSSRIEIEVVNDDEDHENYS